jgi:hypothetical protein
MSSKNTNTNINLNLNAYLEIQKCNKQIEILMWAHGNARPLFQSSVDFKYNTLMNEYNECIKNITDKN